MKAIGVIVTFLTAIALSSVIHGWALMKLWGWFIFPYFDVPMITIPVAIGISLIVGMLAIKPDQINSNEKRSSKDAVAQLIGNMLSPIVVVFIGWIVTLFM